ncbi:MAG: methyltransferase domain-containing protein [Microthrixaceae bacterium]|jgi:SAM-dependent methyltransferase
MAHDHHHSPAHDRPVEADADPEAFWNDLYGARDQVWSGRPNHWLVDLATDLAPGRALDLGSGEGGDAVWLADRGWTVTAVDVSTTALERAAAAAERSGVGAAIDWQRHDLADSFPTGEFDLVSAQFLQSPIDFPRDDVLRRAAAAVAPDGHLLVVAHAAMPAWSNHTPPPGGFPTVEGTVDALDLGGEQWTIVVAEEREREGSSPDGHSGTLIDSVVFARRR